MKGSQIKVSLDDDTTLLVRNHCKVIIKGDIERHITVTDEGLIVDLIADGEVIASRHFLHEDLLEVEEGE